MANPFTIRATEFVKSNEAFLTLITPDPISFFLQPHASDDGLYRRLLSIQGQPGSGKTTIARMFEFSTLATLLRGTQNDTYSELISPMQKCGAISEGHIQIIACRLPLESDYRELWQLPYSERVRTELLQRLIQARTILAWFGQLRKAGVEPEEVTLASRDDIHAPLTFMGGEKGPQILERAKAVEAAIYRIVGALLPPPEAEIESQIVEPFRPFEVMEFLQLSQSAAQKTTSAPLLRPIVILDDAHFLHGAQLEHLKTWLIRRELKIGRWILSRLDVLNPKDLFDSLAIEDTDVNMPGITAGRDIIRINLQSAKRSESRRNFRSMAREMSNKYLGQMPIFGENSISTLESILPAKIEPISPSNCDKLRISVQSAVRRLHISPQRLTEIEKMVVEFLAERPENSEDLRLAMTRILLHRYSKRTPQASLFLDELTDAEPSKPLRADLGVYDGACIHLMHEFDRPFYVGFDALSDTASENAETFLRVASHIVEAAENLLIKQKPSTIPARDQHRLLVERANMIVETWKFPEYRRVRAIAQWIAERCKQRTLEPNAPLGHGANAYGILQSDFDRIGSDYLFFANVLKYGVAYNALNLVMNYPCKGKAWCLIELGGTFIVHSGLPFKRGGFVEGTIEELDAELKSRKL